MLTRHETTTAPALAMPRKGNKGTCATRRAHAFKTKNHLSVRKRTWIPAPGFPRGLDLMHGRLRALCQCGSIIPLDGKTIEESGGAKGRNQPVLRFMPPREPSKALIAPATNTTTITNFKQLYSTKAVSASLRLFARCAVFLLNSQTKLAH